MSDETAKDALKQFFGSPRLASALTVTAVALATLSWPIGRVIGLAGLLSALGVLVLLCTASLIARRASLVGTGLLPISLLLFAAWIGISVFWSEYQWATVGGLVVFAAYGMLGVYIALIRDTIQIVRAFGDVLRVVLGLSLVLEVFSGILIDTPITFLGIRGTIADGGSISGLLGNRNELGLLAVIGGLSFVIEWRTRSVARVLAIGSVALAAIVLLLTRSPIAWGTALVAVAVLAALYGIRRAGRARQPIWQVVALGVGVVAAVLAWVFRSRIVDLLNGGGELQYRLELWREMWSLVRLSPVEGWGWIGQWNTQLPPYSAFQSGASRVADSALNAYLDVWFQAGVIGLVLFLLMAGLAFVRSWLLASRQRSVIYTWPAVVLAALLTASLAESGILFGFGWMTFVICCVKASQSLSWRVAFRRPLEQEPLR